MKKLIQKIIWILTNRCKFCGGEVESWDNYNTFNCSKCGKKQ